MKYSLSAIILMVLVAIRAIGQSLIFFMPGQTIISISFFIALIFGVIYLIALAGLFLKTRWGLIMVISIALVDLISFFVPGLGISEKLNIAIIDVILLVLSINILTRFKK